MEPIYQQGGLEVYLGDCLDILPTFPDASVDLVFADPPYGVQKAAWDDTFPTAWFAEACRIAKAYVVVTPGTHNLLGLPPTMGNKVYSWTLAVHLTNGMTKGKLGFANWIPALVYSRPEAPLCFGLQDAVSIPIAGRKVDHPSPKPLRAMTWILSRFPKAASVLDPFAGSGTTLVAAQELGWRGIGIEKNSDYLPTILERIQHQNPLPIMAGEKEVGHGAGDQTVLPDLVPRVLRGHRSRPSLY